MTRDARILIAYWRILRRRWFFPVGLVLLVLGTYVAVYRPPVPAYTASMRFVVGIRPEPGAGDYYTYDRYYTWLTAEYLLDDLSEVVRSQAFADDVAQEAGVTVTPGAISGATATGKLHRILSVTITWPDQQQIEAIAEAVSVLLQGSAATYFRQLSTENAIVSLIDPPSIHQVGPSLRQRVDLPLRLIVALGIGVGIAFLLHALDDTLRTFDDVQGLGIAPLATIPRKPSRLARWFSARRYRKSDHLRAS